jgi:hypothetical protein
MKKRLFIIFVGVAFLSFAQELTDGELPYYQVPDYPEEFTAGTMAARMVDALGFRFYWVSEGLNEKDLVYRANLDGRSSAETIQHVYDLSKIIVNSILKKSNSSAKEDFSYINMRKRTLVNLKTASDILRESDDISQYKIILSNRKYPFGIR